MTSCKSVHEYWEIGIWKPLKAGAGSTCMKNVWLHLKRINSQQKLLRKMSKTIQKLREAACRTSSCPGWGGLDGADGALEAKALSRGWKSIVEKLKDKISGNWKIKYVQFNVSKLIKIKEVIIESCGLSFYCWRLEKTRNDKEYSRLYVQR